MQAFGSQIAVREKNDLSNVVTEADLAAERTIAGFLRAHAPDSGLLAEESGYFARFRRLHLGR